MIDVKSLENSGLVRFQLENVSNKSEQEIDKAKLNVLDYIAKGKFKTLEFNDGHGRK